MTKLNSLLNYLIKNSFYEEANYLFKFANNQSPEEYLQENYPNIYAVSLNDRKPATAYINIINQLRNKGYSDEEIKGLQINNFQELITKLREEKADPKKEFLDKVKKQVGANISDEELLYAREKGLTPEETIFLVEDKTAHPFSAKVDWAFKFNQNKNKHEDLKDKEITDYQNIDEVDKALSDKITYSEEYMKDFYVGIKSKAEETSEVIYNSLNYVVSHSKSKEAAQWWEQSCVSYNPRTKKVDAGLCTAKHEGNLYDEYYSDGYLVQIITKPSTSNSPSPETNFKDKNYSWNLISLHIYDDGELSQEHGSTVNRLNQDVTPCEIKDALGDEYNKIIEAISGYFNENFKIQISGFDCGEEEDAPNILKLIKKDELNEKDIQFLKDLSSEDYFDYKLDIKFKKDYKDIFDKNYRHIVKNFPETYFENNLGKYRDEKPEYLELFEDALNRINASSYFEYNLDKKYRDEKPKYFNIFKRNLNKINSEDYFKFKLDERYKKEYLEVFKWKLRTINPKDFFELELDEKYKDQEYFKIINKSNINTIPAYNFFKLKLDEKYKDESKEYLEILKKNLHEVNKSFYFEFKLDEKYAENYPLIHISKNSLREYFEKKLDEKYPEGLPIPSESRRYFEYNYRKDALIPIKDLLKKLSPEDYFELGLDEKYKKYTDVLKENLNKTDSEYYFFYKLDKKHKEYTEVFEKKLKDVNSTDYFEYKLDEKYDKYTDIFEENLKLIDAKKYFEYKLDEKYRDKNEEYFKIFKWKLNRISTSSYFELELDKKYKKEYLKVFEEKLNDIDEYEYFRLKLDQKYKDENQEYFAIFKSKLKDISFDNFFELKLDETYPEYMEYKLNLLSAEKYFNEKFDEKYDKYTDILEKNLKRLDFDRYFKFKLDEKYKKDYLDIFERNLNNIYSASFFEYALDEKYRNENPEYFKIFEEKLNNVSLEYYFNLKLDEKYKEYTDILRRNKEALYEKYYSKIFEENKISDWAVSDYYTFNVGNFFKKYYPELSEKIDNKFKELN